MKGEVSSLSWYLKCSMGSMAGPQETENAVEQRAFKSARKEQVKRK